MRINPTEFLYNYVLRQSRFGVRFAHVVIDFGAKKARNVFAACNIFIVVI